MVLGAASRNIGKMIILLSARWICLTLCFGRLSWRNVQSISHAELLPWVGWCYGSHPTLWHPLGQLSSETGVQQGDPLGPLLIFLVLHKLVLSIAQDKDCLSLLSNRWYLDDGVLSGHSQAVTRVVTLIQEMGPSMGLFINVSKCELFGHGDLSSFPPEMKVSRVPNLEFLGAPIGDPAKFLAQSSETPIPIGRSRCRGSPGGFPSPMAMCRILQVGAPCPFHTSFIRR